MTTSEQRPQPLPAPLAAPLQYAGLDLARPGVLTALAICSIIFGGLGVVYNALSAVGSVIQVVQWDPWVTPSLPGTSADTTPVGSLTDADASQVVDALAQKQTLTDEERARLVDALKRAESPVAPPASGMPWSSAHVMPQIVDSATHEAGEAIDEPSEEGATGETYLEREIYFDFSGNGDIYVYSDRINFYALPMDGSYVDTIIWSDGRLEVDDDRPGPWYEAVLWGTLVLELLAIVLACALLVAGIQLLRDKAAGLWLHRRWAWAKIALSVATLVVTTFYLIELQPELEYELGTLAWPVVVVLLMLQLIFTTVYPVAVLIVLMTRRVQEWYGIETAAKAPG